MTRNQEMPENQSISKDFLIGLAVKMISALIGVGVMILLGFAGYINSQINDFETELTNAVKAITGATTKLEILERGFVEHKGSEREHPDNTANVQMLLREDVQLGYRVGKLEESDGGTRESIAIINTKLDNVIKILSEKHLK